MCERSGGDADCVHHGDTGRGRGEWHHRRCTRCDGKCDGKTDFGCHSLYGLKVQFEDEQAAAFTAACCAALRDATKYYHAPTNKWLPFTSDEYDECVTQLRGNNYECSVDTMYLARLEYDGRGCVNDLACL